MYTFSLWQCFMWKVMITQSIQRCLSCDQNGGILISGQLLPLQGENDNTPQKLGCKSPTFAVLPLWPRIFWRAQREALPVRHRVSPHRISKVVWEEDGHGILAAAMTPVELLFSSSKTEKKNVWLMTIGYPRFSPISWYSQYIVVISWYPHHVPIIFPRYHYSAPSLIDENRTCRGRRQSFRSFPADGGTQSSQMWTRHTLIV